MKKINKSHTQCLKPTQLVSFLRAERATLISKKKTLGYYFLPLKNSFEFLQILGIYSIERITNQESEGIFKGPKRINQGCQNYVL